MLLHRIRRGCTVVGMAVPVFGIATGAQMGMLGYRFGVVADDAAWLGSVCSLG